ncbi:C10 family peptidase [Parabacteroides faecis]|uniref:C10 family peptidase n=1 Tax=Parabacteroides faecis TaxID=1217282 RepID=UPI00351FB718
MKKILQLTLVFFSFLLFACQTNEMDEIVTNNKKVQLSSKELLCIKYENFPELSQNELYGLVENFQLSELADKPNTRSISNVTSFEIKNKYYLNKERGSKDNLNTRSTENTQEQIPIYEIGITSNEKKGMALVSGDRRAPHVLAYIDRINENDSCLFTGPNALVQWGEMCVQNAIEAFEVTKDSIYASAILKISKELNMNPQDIKYENIKDVIEVSNQQTRSTAIDEVPSNLQNIVSIIPMCPSAWGQWEPYNCQLPEGDCEKFFPGWVESSHYPTGIGAVSLAHLMACLEPNITAYGTKIDWDLLTENKEIKAPDYFSPGDPVAKRNMVGYLFKLIYVKTNSKPVKNSKGVVTGISCTVPDMESYLRSVFNCGNTSSWSKYTILNSLKNRQPVYVYGKPDNKESTGVYPFILDGYRECYGRIDNVPEDINIKYIHANFGFGGGSQDGYYLMDVKTETISFDTKIPLIFKDKALTMIPNIRRK